MTDLDNIPFDKLEAAYLERRKKKIEEKKETARQQPCCRNCAHRIWGRVYKKGMTNHETWVCELKPKKRRYIKYNLKVPPYLRAFESCATQCYGCSMFLHRESEEGKRLIEKRHCVADRISSDDFTI